MEQIKYHIDEILDYVSRVPFSAFFYTPVYKNKNAQSVFFKKCGEVFGFNKSADIQEYLAQVDVKLSEGLEGYSILPYELGFFLDDYLSPLQNKHIISLEGNLKFCFFESSEIERFSSQEISFENYDFSNVSIEDFKLLIDEQNYLQSVENLRTYIGEGDTYQVNYTISSSFKLVGKPTELFKKIIFNQSANYAAFINLGDRIILSNSPELFFFLNGNTIISKPMKGTIKRGKDILDDENQKSTLFSSEKDRAENLMIVDLIRNDFGKIATIDSVKVEKLFEVEKYETVFQMTSTISSQLKDNIRFSNILSAIFPCGSITGAPKLRTIQIIDEIENHTRGLYTGSIGLILKEKAVFNIPIRTIEYFTKSQTCKLGLGSGIVWDSNPNLELDEVKLKSNFLLESNDYFELIESMRVDGNVIPLLDKHLTRLQNASEYFLFEFDEKSIISNINITLNNLEPDKSYKMRLLLSKWGRSEIKVEEINTIQDKVKCLIHSELINSSDKFQYFKTNNRKLYSKTVNNPKYSQYFDVIYFNEKNELCEGARTNIFIRKDEKYFTPEISSGILNGIMREKFIQDVSAIQTKLFLEDLLTADEVILTNSVRGIIKVDEIIFGE